MFFDSLSTPAAMAGATPDSLGASRTLNASALSGSSGLGTPYRGQTAQLRALIATKEKELHDATEFRLGALEEMLNERVRPQLSLPLARLLPLHASNTPAFRTRN